MQVLKRCTTCQIDKELVHFRKQAKNKDGLKYTCKNCDDDRAKQRYETKKEQILITVKAWQAKNRKPKESQGDKILSDKKDF